MAFENEQCRILVEQGRLTEDQARYAMNALQGQKIDVCELLMTWGHIGESTAEMVRLLVTQGSQQKIFGNYEILGELSRGGMGVVYKACHNVTKKVVALKLMLDGSDAEESLRFRREAQALAKLSHRHIVPIYDCGYHDNVPYFTMELVEGNDLNNYVLDHVQSTGQAPDWEWCCEIICQIASALEECHKQGLYHRDIKPQNILIRNDSLEPILVDFGLVKVYAKKNPGATMALSLTSEGQLLGTPAFMAPEQFDGIKGTIGAPADVWGLAGTLYFCLTGERPFEGEDPISIFLQVKAGFKQSKLSVKHYSAPEPLSQLLKDCFVLDPLSRPTMPSFREALEDASVAPESGPSEYAVKLIAGALLLMLFAVIGIIALELVSTPENPEIEIDSGKTVSAVKSPIQILFSPPVKKGILNTDGPIALTVRGESLAKILVNGQSFPVNKRSISIPIEKIREILVKVTNFDGQVESRSIEVVPRSSLIRALKSRKIWNEIQDWERILIAKDLESQLKNQGFRFDSLKEFGAGNQSHKIAVYKHQKTGIVFHLLPGDRFKMGTVDGPKTLAFCQSNSRPMRKVKFEDLIELEIPAVINKVEPFLMSCHEVSVGTWQSQMNGEQSASPNSTLRNNLRDKQPMIGLHWESANNWVRRLGSGFRLPNEHEWEYACRAGTETHFFWGNDMTKIHANIQRDRDNLPYSEILEDVDRHENRTNAFGLVHMTGNASEWVFEPYMSYRRGEPILSKKKRARLLRGGSVFSGIAAGRSRARWRTFGRPALRTIATGFRVSFTIPPAFLKN